MREIKFRAWDKKKKKIEYFSLREVCTLGYNLTFKKYADKIFMQYTGLKDTSIPPKDIFEGDIISISQTGVGDNDIREVYSNKGCFRVRGEWSLYDISENHVSCKVIGNIYENGDLL